MLSRADAALLPSSQQQERGSGQSSFPPLFLYWGKTAGSKRATPGSHPATFAADPLRREVVQEVPTRFPSRALYFRGTPSDLSTTSTSVKMVISCSKDTEGRGDF